jgi:hypothetical protein
MPQGPWMIRYLLYFGFVEGKRVVQLSLSSPVILIFIRFSIYFFNVYHVSGNW